MKRVPHGWKIYSSYNRCRRYYRLAEIQPVLALNSNGTNKMNPDGTHAVLGWSDLPFKSKDGMLIMWQAVA